MFTVLLDEKSYSTKWTPPAESNNSLKVKQPITWEKFPHKHAFIEFLGSTPPPTKVITKDQYRQFIPFNEQVDTDFKGYAIETSVCKHSPPSLLPCTRDLTCIILGPSLFDQFVAWSKEKQPKDENSVDQSELP